MTTDPITGSALGNFHSHKPNPRKQSHMNKNNNKLAFTTSRIFSKFVAFGTSPMFYILGLNVANLLRWGTVKAQPTPNLLGTVYLYTAALILFSLVVVLRRKKLQVWRGIPVLSTVYFLIGVNMWTWIETRNLLTSVSNGKDVYIALTLALGSWKLARIVMKRFEQKQKKLD
jgi:hypothetical protein